MLPFENCTVVLVLHLLSDIQGFIRTLLRLGLQPQQTVVVNIPYSTKSSTVAALWTLGLRKTFLSSEYPIDDMIAEAVEEAGQIASATGTRLLVIEDGGYVGPYLHRHRPDLLKQCLGVVEQTQNGIWQYEATDDEPTVVPQVPIINVAESDLKKDMESPLIGEAIHFNVVDLVRRLGYGIGTLRTLIVGYGATGREVTDIFRRSHPNNPPVVFDQDPERMEAAAIDGHEVASDLATACSDAELIIGCTGRESLPGSVLLGLGPHCYFANGSSKRRELDWAALDGMTISSAMLPGGVGRELLLPGERRLALLADGYPVNFTGESVPDEEIAFVYALLLRSAQLLVENEWAPGFHDVPAELQEQIKHDHYEALGRTMPVAKEGQ